MRPDTFTLTGRILAHHHSSLMNWEPCIVFLQREHHLPTLMTLVDRKWLQRTLTVLTKESPSVVTVVLDLSDGLGESVTMAILAAAESMIADG